MPSLMSCQNILVSVSAIFLFLYFFQRPEVDVLVPILIFGIWSAAMMLDLQITFANEFHIARHEQSIILAFAYGKFSRNFAIFLTVLIELSCVVFFPLVIVFEMDAGISAAIAYFFTLLHIIATYGNERFVKKIL